MVVPGAIPKGAFTGKLSKVIPTSILRKCDRIFLGLLKQEILLKSLPSEGFKRMKFLK